MWSTSFFCPDHHPSHHFLRSMALAMLQNNFNDIVCPNHKRVHVEYEGEQRWPESTICAEWRDDHLESLEENDDRRHEDELYHHLVSLFCPEHSLGIAKCHHLPILSDGINDPEYQMRQDHEDDKIRRRRRRRWLTSRIRFMVTHSLTGSWWMHWIWMKRTPIKKEVVTAMVVDCNKLLLWASRSFPRITMNIMTGETQTSPDDIQSSSAPGTRRGQIKSG